jgi:ligand-binding sensor domain-containing protein
MKMEGDSLHLLPGGEWFANKRIYVMLPFDEKRILIGTRNDGLFLFDGTSFQRFITEADAFLQQNEIYLPGAVINDSTFALGTLRGGLAIINRRGEFIKHIDKEDGLQNNSIFSVLPDRQGALWLALNNGLARVEISSPLSYYDAGLGIEANVYSVLRHKGTLYVGTDLGVYYLRPQQKIFQSIPDITAVSWQLLSFDNRLLLATLSGVYEIHGNQANFIRESINYDYRAFSLCRSQKNRNRIFVGLENGLASLRFENGHWIDEGKILGINEEILNIVESNDGQLWLGTNATGVIRVNFSNNFQLENPHITNLGVENGLPPFKEYLLAAHQETIHLKKIF